MESAGASLEVQVIIALGAYFAIKVVIAVIELWYGTTGDYRTR